LTGSKNHEELLAAALLLPLATMSRVANVDQTYGHWQKATRQAEQRLPNAYPGPMVTDQHPTSDFKLCTYQGGPKITICAVDARTEPSGRTTRIVKAAAPGLFGASARTTCQQA
jgi:hypothetical protein